LLTFGFGLLLCLVIIILFFLGFGYLKVSEVIIILKPYITSRFFDLLGGLFILLKLAYDNIAIFILLKWFLGFS
jgi:hypothetical protein